MTLATLVLCMGCRATARREAMLAPKLTGDLVTTASRLRSTVTTLAGSIGERNIFRAQAYARAARLIRTRLERMGYAVRESTFVTRGVPCRTLETTRTGVKRPKEIVLVGAHYDTARRTPGADDNASGVAALLELARRARSLRPARSIRFVAFPNEEPPFFRNSRTMGSLRYAAQARRRGEDLRAVMVLETIGYYLRTKGSQRFPRGMRGPPGRRGDFVAIVGDEHSRRLVREVTSVYRRSSAVAALPVIAPRSVRGVAWSDHASFWDYGYPAVMITDTALFRNRRYHRRSDTPETLDYAALAHVVRGVWEVVRHFSMR